MTWPEFLKANYSAATAWVYGRDVEHYLAWVGGEAAALAADYSTVVAYVRHLRDQYPQPTTVRRSLAPVKVYHGYLLRSGQRSDHPAASLVLRDDGRRRGQLQLQDLLGEEELQKLLSAPVKLYDRLVARGVPIVVTTSAAGVTFARDSAVDGWRRRPNGGHHPYPGESPDGRAESGTGG